MRIAYLVSTYPAVSHTFIRREVEALRRRGAEISTFSVHRADVSSLQFESDQEEASRTGAILPVGPMALLVDHAWGLATRPRAYFETLRLSRSHRLPGLRGWLWAWFHFVEAVRLARMLDRARVSHLHSHFANPGATVGLLAAAMLGLRWSVTLHGRADFSYPAVALLGDKVRRAEFVACVSHFGRASALSYLHPQDDPDAADEKIFVVRCGLDSRTLPARTTSGGAGGSPMRDGPLRILSVGRLSPEKAQVGLVEAVASLIRDGFEVELEIVGEGPERARLEERIRRLDVGAQCRLMGAMTEAEVFERLGRADVFALSSLIEGLPVSLVEAMALDVPVVAPRLAGIPELVEEGRTGLLFHPADWAGLAACLRRLIEDPALRSKLVVQAREKVEREFDVDRAVDPLWSKLRGGEARTASQR